MEVINEDYLKKCYIIEQLVMDTYKNTNHTFDFVFKCKTNHMEIIINENKCITYLDDKWKHLKKRIEKIIELKNGRDCLICCNPIESSISCNECCNSWCGECYINIFKSNQGIIKCPFCKNEYGDYCPPYMMEVCIEDIRNKLNKKNGK